MTPRDMSDVRAEVPAAGLDDEERVAEAQERLKDAEVEFGPDSPPRGASPGNPEAEENPS
jgi:hypothetical protein